MPTISSQLASTDPRPGPRLAGVRVLLVEDDPDTRDIVATLLEQAGAEVIAVSSAVRALTEFEKRHCDVVVTDYALPGSETGHQLMQRIRRLPVDADVPVIGYSAHADMVPPEQQAAFTVYISKPAVITELVDVLRRLLRSRA